jgi:hypothetical protein
MNQHHSFHHKPMTQPTPSTLCLHCERAPQANAYRLCERCVTFKGLRNIYKKRPGWTPAWDAHVQKLVDRASKGLPLFPAGEVQDLPPRPLLAANVRHNTRPRQQLSQEKRHGSSAVPSNVEAVSANVAANLDFPGCRALSQVWRANDPAPQSSRPLLPLPLQPEPQ